MQFFDAQATRAALPFERLIPALRALFSSGCEMPARHVHQIAAAGDSADTPENTPANPPRAAGLTSLIMPAWLPGRFYGIKTVNIAPGNAALGLPGLHSSYLLFDATTGAPLAWMDGDPITARRTAATSALAASWLALPDAGHLLLVGAGQVARLLPEAMRVVRPIRRVTVWARSAPQAAALARSLGEQGFEASATADLAAAAAEADIVSCATLATTPLLQGGWLRAGSHLDLIGSFTPAMREADDACIAGAGLYLDTEEALTKSGDLIGPLARGVFSANGVRGSLASLARGQATGRRTANERTVFKSVGSGLADLAAAMLVYQAGTGAAPGPP